MIIERLRIEALGSVRGLDTGPRPLDNFVVLLGTNEAGKTTIMEAIRILLYGFYPAQRDVHPLTPWEGDTVAELEGWIRQSENERLYVQRRLLSQPAGTQRELAKDDEWEASGQPMALGNRDLPGLDAVRRQIYSQTHTLTLPEITTFGTSDPWTQIRDRILAGMGTADMVPPRTVADLLHQEGLRLWRPDRKGSSRHRELEKALREARSRLAEARRHEHDVKEAKANLIGRQGELHEAQQRREQMRTRLAEARRIRPMVQQAVHLARLKQTTGDPATLVDLPLDIVRAAGDVQRRVQEEERAHHDVLEALQKRDQMQPTVLPGDRFLLAARDTISMLRGLGLRMEEETQERRKRERNAEELEDRVRGLAQPLLEAPPGVNPDADPLTLALAHKEALDRIPLNTLQTALSDWAQNRSQLEDAELALNATTNRPTPAPPQTSPPSTFWLLTGLGALVLVVALLLLLAPGDRGLTPILMALLGGTALILTSVWLRRDHIHAEAQHARKLEDLEVARAEARTKVDHFRQQLDQGRKNIGRLLDGLPLRASLLDQPQAGLDRDLLILKERLHDLERAKGQVDGTRSAALAFQKALDTLRHLREKHGGEGVVIPFVGDEPPQHTAERLEQHAEKAQERQWTLERWQRDREEDERRVADAARRLEKARSDKEDLDRKVQRAEPNLVEEEALSVLESRLAAQREATGIEREWITQFGSVESVYAQIEPWHEHPIMTNAGADEAEEEVQRTQDIIERLREDIRGLEKEITAPVDLTPDLIEGEILAIQEEMRDVLRTRDQLRVLQALVVRGEDEFRQREQPPLLREADTLLQRLTANRYGGLLLQADRDAHLTVSGEHLPEPQPIAEPLSTGTREQIWFSLRMAALSGVEGGGHPLPLILDEVLVNWDETRRSYALQAIAKMSQNRQIFLLTCHPAMAKEAEAAGAFCIPLPAPSSNGAQ